MGLMIPEGFCCDEVYGVMVGDQEAWWVFRDYSPKKLFENGIFLMSCYVMLVFSGVNGVESLLSRHGVMVKLGSRELCEANIRLR